MLLALLTYYQVMPAFLDILFCFGRQRGAEDFYYTVFKTECRLDDTDPGLQVDALKRSGQYIQMCYNLRSVDLDRKQNEWKFRNTGIHHSFDAVNGRSNWILIRGDESMKQKLRSATQSSQQGGLRALDTPSKCLRAALITHLCLFEWSNQHWTAFINDMEHTVRQHTAGAHDKNAGKVRDPTLAIAMLARSQTAPEPPARSGTFTSLPMLRSSTFKGLERKLTGMIHRPRTANSTAPASPSTLPEEDTADDTAINDAVYDVSAMQTIEALEEKANAALLIVSSNEEVLEQLASFYTSIQKRANFPKFWGKSYEQAIYQFTCRLSEVQSELRHHQARLRTLLALLADRKTLIHGIIQYRGIQASKMLGESTHSSALKMQGLTEEMSEVARQTQKDTVSMRIITVITLIFLPGTFISTLMSTDIIRYSSDNGGPPTRVFSRKALDLFLIICLPLMFITVMAWIVTQYILDRRAKARRLQKEKEALSA